MKISDVEIRRVQDDERVLAYVTLIFDDSFVVHDVKVIKGDKGLFVAMPSRKSKYGQYRDIVHPINAEVRSYIEGCVLKAYEESSTQEKESAEE